MHRPVSEMLRRACAARVRRKLNESPLYWKWRAWAWWDWMRGQRRRRDDEQVCETGGQAAEEGRER